MYLGKGEIASTGCWAKHTYITFLRSLGIMQGNSRGFSILEALNMAKVSVSSDRETLLFLLENLSQFLCCLSS
jgi:hypothetical protein